ASGDPLPRRGRARRHGRAREGRGAARRLARGTRQLPEPRRREQAAREPALHHDAGMNAVLLWSYAVAAVAYAALTAFLLIGREPERRGQWVLVALAGTAVWGVAVAVVGAFAEQEAVQPRFALIPDALRAALWILCLVTALPARSGWQ